MSETDVKAISRRRGVSAEFDTFTSGLEGEITVNTTNNSVVVSDGNGSNFEAARADMFNVDQFDLLKKGVASNDLRNTVVKYVADTDGTISSENKSSEEIVAQLTDAYIADKNLENVPLPIMLEKGVAERNLKNVPFKALSWDDPTDEDHIASSAEDSTGGGFAMRNLKNMKAETFSSISTNDENETGGGVAYKTLKNCLPLEEDTKKTLGVANLSLTNVLDNDFYGKEDVDDLEGDSGKYVLKRDFSNIDGERVSKNSLTNAKIAAMDLSNVVVADKDKDSVLEKIGAPNYQLSKVDPDVLTNTRDGRFKLMKHDGSNADKNKVFKGRKNLLLNSNFEISHDCFKKVSSLNEVELASVGDVFYSNWVCYEDGSQIFSDNGEVSFTGTWGQYIEWDHSFDSLTSLFASVDVYFQDFNVYLAQYIDGELLPITDKLFIGTPNVDYDKFGCELFFNDNLIKGEPFVFCITAENVSHFKNIQLERYGISNYEMSSQKERKKLTKDDVVIINKYKELPLLKEEYYALRSLFTSDLYVNGYVKKSDISFEPIESSFVPYGVNVYVVVSDKVEFYTNAAEGEFDFMPNEDGTIKIETLNSFSNWDLIYSEKDKRIFTVFNGEYCFYKDPVPYKNCLYLAGEKGKEEILRWNPVSEEFYAVSTKGDSSTGLPLFMHILSDRKLESVSWAEADSFSEKNAEIYKDAYNYLINQLHPVGKLKAGSDISDVSFEVGHAPTWFIEWSDNEYEDTNVFLTTQKEQALIELRRFCESKGYSYKNDTDFSLTFSRELKELEENGIHFYRSFDGIKLVKNTTENVSAINSLYKNTGYAWYYVINETGDVKTSFFKLPRCKGFAIEDECKNESFGDLYKRNIQFQESSASDLSMISKRLYFYVGKANVFKEEVSLNQALNSFREISFKKNKVIETNLFLDYEEREVDLVVSENISSYYLQISSDMVVNIDLISNILGASEPYIDGVSGRYIYPKQIYDKNTQFSFDLIVDTRGTYDEDSLDVSFNNKFSHDLISKLRFKAQGIYFLKVKTKIKENFLLTDRIIERNMFDFEIFEVDNFISTPANDVQGNAVVNAEWVRTNAVEISPKIITNTNASGTFVLEANKIYRLNITGNISFSLPTPLGDWSDRHRQIKVMFYMPTLKSINWGTSFYVNGEAPDVSTVGTYEAIFTEFNGAWWWVGVLKIG